MLKIFWFYKLSITLKVFQICFIFVTQHINMLHATILCHIKYSLQPKKNKRCCELFKNAEKIVAICIKSLNVYTWERCPFSNKYFQWKRDEEEVTIKESRSKPNIDCAIMCSAQELHTYTDFKIDKQYFFQRIFSTAQSVPQIWPYHFCLVSTKHDGFPLCGSKSFMVWQND